MTISVEVPQDAAAVRAVHLAAFATSVEADLLDALRAEGDLLAPLCLVARVDGAVVGEVATSRGTVSGVDGLVAGVGPVGVLPAHQGTGLGTALVRAVVAAADAAGLHALVLLGDPDFYSRSGFRPAADLGLDSPDPAWGAHFQAVPLSAWDSSARGTFAYAAAFDRL